MAPALAALPGLRSEDLFVEARRAPALAALPGLRSEALFVEGPPGALERAGRPSPTVADLVRISAPDATLAALCSAPEKAQL